LLVTSDPNRCIALVTGAGGGIGRGVAGRLASLGREVICSDLSASAADSTAKVIEADGGRAHPWQLDVANPESIALEISRMWGTIGPVQEVVTGAGVVHIGPLLSLRPEVWDRTINVNLRGTFLTFQQAALHLVDADLQGSFVAVASVAGRSGRPLSPDYAASKAGVLSVVKSLALSLASNGIRVNAVCPGVVDTPMTRQIHRERGSVLGVSEEDSMAELALTIPLGRIETVEEVVDAVEFLLLDRAAYVTGQALNVCGGLEFN
jgi:NAD(P)-dependent dehydrogenase (short-subunit alcohol dehydrogenase family)